MKRCFKCLCEKPLSEFYAHAMMADKHLNKCKECTKSDVKKHRLDNIERVRSYDKMRASMPHRVAAMAERQKLWRKQHPDRHKAHMEVRKAIKSGRLVPWPTCAVPGCQGKPEAHHPDYSRPLDVVWLCTVHHCHAHMATF